MKYDEFRRLLRRSGWQVSEFALAFGLAQRTLSNYGGDGKKLPQVWAIVALLLHELVQCGVPKQRILNRISEMQPQPQPRRPRGSSRGLRRPAVAASASAAVAGQEGPG